jgi:hypothetical protein
MKERFGRAVVFAYNSQQSRLNVLTSTDGAEPRAAPWPIAAKSAR